MERREEKEEKPDGEERQYGEKGRRERKKGEEVEGQTQRTFGLVAKPLNSTRAPQYPQPPTQSPPFPASRPHRLSAPRPAPPPPPSPATLTSLLSYRNGKKQADVERWQASEDIRKRRREAKKSRKKKRGKGCERSCCTLDSSVSLPRRIVQAGCVKGESGKRSHLSGKRRVLEGADEPAPARRHRSSCSSSRASMCHRPEEKPQPWLASPVQLKTV